MRRIAGIFLVAITVALTVAFVIVVFQAITGDFVGSEAAIVWTIAGFVGLLTAVAWIGAVPFLKSVDLKSAKKSELMPFIGGSVISAILVVWWAL